MLKAIISLIFGAVLLMSTVVGAEQDTKRPIPELPLQEEYEKQYGAQLYWLQMPVICGTSESVMAYLEKFQFTLVNVSYGRDRAKQTGDPVFVVMYYVDPSYTQSIVVMTTMDGMESCMLYKSFDLQFMPKKQGIGL
tara:strand:- start:30 stop:440 length:411 start_codon:yes stop_codon:yes gene_type:complete